MRSMLVMPLTAPSASIVAPMIVPGDSGAKLLRMQMGMPCSIAGAIVCGWMTRAPK
jgi:hypothetical protein